MVRQLASSGRVRYVLGRSLATLAWVEGGGEGRVKTGRDRCVCACTCARTGPRAADFGLPLRCDGRRRALEGA